MKVTMLTRAAGALNASPGQCVDVSDAQAKELIAGGYASAVEVPKPKPELKKATPTKTKAAKGGNSSNKSD